MPLGRYFLLMGGALLMVLLVAGAYLPSPPVVEQVETRQPKIRIHSDKKLPERVVFDTSVPAVTHPVDPTRAETDPPSSPPSADDLSAKARQAFARLQSSDEQGEGGRAKAGRIQNFAVAKERNKEARANTAQDQACTATSVRLVRRQDVVVKHWEGDAMVSLIGSLATTGCHLERSRQRL